MKIAIIGAGISGLTLARELSAKAEVTVFEKARGVGGRMSTRYADPYYFDHGTQFFTARNKKFQAFLAPYIAKKRVQEWSGKLVTLAEGKPETKRLWFEPHYVATPNMNSLCKELAEGCTVKSGVEVAPLGEKHADGWHVQSKEGEALGVFDVVISTAPPVQTVKLFAGHVAEDAPIAKASLLGCYTLMLGFNRPWDKQWIGAKVQDSPLEWIAVNSTKPERNPAITCLVVHSRNDWAEAHIDDNMTEAQAYLVNQVERVTGIDCSKADYAACHRWRYALVQEVEEAPPYYNAALGLAAVSDWGAASRIESCWVRAMQLAAEVAAV